jgi:hypothetical protein
VTLQATHWSGLGGEHAVAKPAVAGHWPWATVADFLCPAVALPTVACGHEREKKGLMLAYSGWGWPLACACDFLLRFCFSFTSFYEKTIR